MNATLIQPLTEEDLRSVENKVCSTTPRYYTEVEAGTILGVTRKTLYNWRRNGLLPYKTTPTGGIRYALEDIQSVMKDVSIN